MPKCGNRNGTYVCQRPPGHDGLHHVKYFVDDEPKIAKWVDQYGGVKTYKDNITLAKNFERVDAAQAYISTRIRGEHTLDGVKLESAHLAIQVATNTTGGVIFSGGRDELIELATRIIEAAIVGELRREGDSK